jgi:hypothetical protein
MNPIDPCKHCGGRAVLGHYGSPETYDEIYQYIECSAEDCQIRLTDWGGQGTEWLVNAWNRTAKI